MKQKLKAGCLSLILILAVVIVFVSLITGVSNLYWRFSSQEDIRVHLVETEWLYSFFPLAGGKIIFHDVETFTYTYYAIAGGEFGYTGNIHGRWHIRDDNSIELNWEDYPTDDPSHITVAHLNSLFGSVLQIEDDISLQSHQTITQMNSRFYHESWGAWMLFAPCGTPLLFLSVLTLLLFAGFSWYKKRQPAAESDESEEL